MTEEIAIQSIETDNQLLDDFNKEVSLRRALRDVTELVPSDKNGQLSK